jgi:ComF family protein
MGLETGRNSVRRVFRGALDAVLPPRCLKCGDVLTVSGSGPSGSEGGLCPDCWRKISWLAPPCCVGCGQPFPFAAGPDARCGACLRKPPAYDRARAVFRYDTESRDLILAFKQADRTESAPVLAGWMARAGAELLESAELIVPVPLHWRRLVRRRFNQAALLARILGRLSDRAVEPQALMRRRATESQGRFGRLGRFRNVAGVIAASPKYRKMLENRQILLIDDVITTGATANAAAKALISAGARGVDVLTLAKVVLSD